MSVCRKRLFQSAPLCRGVFPLICVMAVFLVMENFFCYYFQFQSIFNIIINTKKDQRRLGVYKKCKSITDSYPLSHHTLTLTFDVFFTLQDKKIINLVSSLHSLTAVAVYRFIEKQL